MITLTPRDKTMEQSQNLYTTAKVILEKKNTTIYLLTVVCQRSGLLVQGCHHVLDNIRLVSVLTSVSNEITIIKPKVEN